MKTSTLINRLMIAALLATAGIVASCGETGIGTSGISLSANVCPGDGDFFFDSGTDTGVLISAGDTYGRALIVATKPEIVRTSFGNDTILDSTPGTTDIPAAGVPIYITAVASFGSGFTSDSYLAVGPIGGTAETLPTVFFTDDLGRLDTDIFFNFTATLPAGAYPFNVTFQVDQGSALVNCEFKLNVKDIAP